MTTVAEWKAGSQKVVKKITKGCPQSSICGPIFWDFAIEPLLDTLDRDDSVGGVVAYADGLLVPQEQIWKIRVRICRSLLVIGATKTNLVQQKVKHYTYYLKDHVKGSQQ